MTSGWTGGQSAEDRRSPRKRVARAATMIASPHAPEIPCVVLELSATGAKLHVHGSQDLPQRFQLAIEQDGLMRPCTLIWRRRNHAGIQFL